MRLRRRDERVEGELGGRVVVCGEVEANLDELHVPVAELAPEELVDGTGRFVEAIVPERAVDLRGDRGEARVDPAGFKRNVFVRGLLIQIDPVAGVRPRSTCMKRKRAAFQILLAKAR